MTLHQQQASEVSCGSQPAGTAMLSVSWLATCTSLKLSITLQTNTFRQVTMSCRRVDVQSYRSQVEINNRERKTFHRKRRHLYVKITLWENPLLLLALGYAHVKCV